MAAAVSERAIRRDMRRAASVERKSGGLITDPFARFNLNLGGGNPDWMPKKGQGSGYLFVRRLTHEFSQKVRVETGQKINTLLLNGDRLEADEQKRGLVYLPEVNTAITDGPCNNRLRSLAKQLGCPVLGLDTPNVGQSSKYTKEQYAALAQQQDYGPTADVLAQAIIKTGMKEVSLVGASLGAWTGPLVVAKLKERGIVVHDLILVDPPSAQDKPWKTLVAEEMGEGKYLDLYHSRPYDHALREASGDNTPFGIKAKIGGIKWLGSALLKFRSNLALVKTIVKGSLEANIRAAFGDQEGDDSKMQLTYIYGSLDRVSPREANMEIITNLKHDFPDQVHRVVMPGEHHLVYENGNRFAALVGLSLIDSPLLKKEK